jgi:hypothetical protein
LQKKSALRKRESMQGSKSDCGCLVCALWGTPGIVKVVAGVARGGRTESTTSTFVAVKCDNMHAR